MLCPECGTDVVADANFCQECGTRRPSDAAAGATESGRGGADPDAPDVGRQGRHDGSGELDQRGADAPPASHRRGPTETFPPVLPATGLWHGGRAVLGGFLAIALLLAVEVGLAIQEVSAIADPGGDAGLAALQVAGAALAELGNPVVAVLTGLGWVFFNAHTVPVEASTAGIGTSVAEQLDVLALAGQYPDLPITPIFYYLVPPIFLVLAGRRVTRSRSLDGVRSALAAGAQVALGYGLVLIALALGATVSLQEPGVSVSLGPPVVLAGLVGVLYATVFGAVGGYLGGS